MADWNTPVLSSAYATVWHPAILARDVDAITLQIAAITNPPVGAFKYVRASDKFQEWSGAAYVDKVLSIAGGGTGSATAGAARTALGLGDMATQSSAAVAITGGAVAAALTGSTSIPAAGLTGTIAQARLGTGSGGAGTKVLYDDQTYKTIPAVYMTVAAVQSADFVAALETIYPLTGSHTVTLPTVVAHAGQKIILVMRGTGIWTVTAAGGETINGAASFTFNYGQYSVIILEADANASLWDII